MNPESGHLIQLAAAAAVLAAAALAHWALRQTQRRLPLVLTRRALGGHATYPDPAIRRAVDLTLLPLTLTVWLAFAWGLTEDLPVLRAAREALSGAVHMAATMPLFELREQRYSLLDVLALPALLGVLWVALGWCIRLVRIRLNVPGIRP